MTYAFPQISQEPLERRPCRRSRRLIQPRITGYGVVDWEDG